MLVHRFYLRMERSHGDEEANLETAEPILVTRPTISWPGTQGVDSGHEAAPLVADLMEVGAIPQKRISICTSCSVGSRRVIVLDASGDVALSAE